MKHQYFGDVNDYVKYGLLRCFAEASFQVGLCWMLTPNDGRPDGRKIKYLSQPEKWKSHDASLFEALSQILAQLNGRHIRNIQTRRLIPRAQFFGKKVPDNSIARVTWYKQALTASNKSNLLFFDPDNGIEIPSKPMGRKDSSKYVYWNELEEAWDRGASLLIFQHFPRVKRHEYIPAIAEELRKRTKASTIVPLRTSNVLFLLAYQPKHKDRIGAAFQMIENRWSRRVWEHKAA